VINDRVGISNIVLVGDAAGRTVRAYERGETEFSKSPAAGTLISGAGEWTISEEHLTGPKGERFGRVAGHIAYWFAWDGYLGSRSALYKGPE
jgi:hypothetical protein